MTSLHGKQYTTHEARVHWILRLLDKLEPETWDAVIILTGAVVVFVLALIGLSLKLGVFA